MVDVGAEELLGRVDELVVDGEYAQEPSLS